MRGCSAMIRHFSQLSTLERTHFQFEIFWSMILDRLSWWCKGVSDDYKVDQMDLYQTLPFDMRNEERAIRYIQALGVWWRLEYGYGPLEDGRYWPWDTILTRLVLLSDHLVLLQKNGRMDTSQFQKLREDLQHSLSALTYLRPLLCRVFNAVSNPAHTRCSLNIAEKIILLPLS